jgi:hypothetical protein
MRMTTVMPRRLRIYLNCPADKYGALTHAAQTQPLVLCEGLLGVEPSAIVFNNERNVVIQK